MGQKGLGETISTGPWVPTKGGKGANGPLGKSPPQGEGIPEWGPILGGDPREKARETQGGNPIESVQKPRGM